MNTELKRIEPCGQDLLPPEQTSSAVLAIITRAASDKTVDVDKMERLLAMHERILARDAEMAFNRSMREAQSKMPRIKKDARNPQTNSLYARLETLNKAIVPIYTDHGFALSYGTADCAIPDHRRVTCRVSHSAGHSRDYFLDLPLDVLGAKGNPNKTMMHGFGSTMSYGRRYLGLMIFNVSTGEDDDGNGQEAESVTKLKKDLWDLVKPIRGDLNNWDIARIWLTDEAAMDSTKRVADLDAGELKALIERVKNRMKELKIT